MFCADKKVNIKKENDKENTTVVIDTKRNITEGNDQVLNQKIIYPSARTKSNLNC